MAELEKRATKAQLPYLWNIGRLTAEENKLLLKNTDDGRSMESLQKIRSGIVSSIVSLSLLGMHDEPLLRELSSYYANSEMDTYIRGNRELSKTVSSYRK